MPASLLTSSLTEGQFVDQGLSVWKMCRASSTQPPRLIFFTALVGLSKQVVKPLTTFRLSQTPWGTNTCQAFAFLQMQAPTCSCHLCSQELSWSHRHERWMDLAGYSREHILQLQSVILHKKSCIKQWSFGFA